MYRFFALFFVFVDPPALSFAISIPHLRRVSGVGDGIGAGASFGLFSKTILFLFVCLSPPLF